MIRRFHGGPSPRPGHLPRFRATASAERPARQPSSRSLPASLTSLMISRSSSGIFPTTQTWSTMIRRSPRRPTLAGCRKKNAMCACEAFLYAASREDDNDFHLIIGRNPERSPSMYMTVELSGLPPKSSKHFSRLSKTRNAYKTFFTDNMPGTTYDFYDPPIPVTVEGSLFFDMSHAHGSKPGPGSLARTFRPSGRFIRSRRSSSNREMLW